MTSIDEAFEEAAGPRLGQHKTRLRRALESPVLTSTRRSLVLCCPSRGPAASSNASSIEVIPSPAGRA